jgi:hypothetical protein
MIIDRSMTKTGDRTYYRLWTSDEYSAEIYDGCTARIAVRGDGLRARIKIDGTQWHGNSGGFVCRKYYVDGREAVKAAIRKLRQLQIAAIKAGYSCHDSNLADAIVGGYWPNYL